MRARSWCWAVLLAGCGDAAVAPTPPPPPSGPTVRMDFAGDFFAAPFPSEHRRGDDGRVRLDGFPNDQSSPYLVAMLRMAEARDGFGASSGIYFTATDDLDAASLPDVPGSVRGDASVFVTPVEGDDAGRARVPLNVTFQREGPPSGAPRLLALLPVAGMPLDPNRLYAAVVTRRVRTSSGAALVPSPAWRAIADGSRPNDLSPRAWESYRRAAVALRGAGLATADIAGVAVFRTGDGAAAFLRAAEVVRSRTTLSAPALAPAEVFADFCVYAGETAVPVFQQGDPPYSRGGAWAFEADGGLARQREERTRVVVTIPRRAMPAGGYPTTLFVRTGGGGDRPLVDRGVRGADGRVLEAGTGLAREFARAGFAGVSWDGPHGGPRNVSGGDEQFLVYNFGNLTAMRDNVRQTALEAVLVARMLGSITVDIGACPGAVAPGGVARLDASRLALFGHSMGASVAPLAFAAEPRFGAMLLSGAGGSWINNVMFKERPLPIRAAAEMLLRYGSARIRGDDPALSVLEWAMEEADAAPYARRLAREATPRHVLMMQGIVDRYIPPPVAQAQSLGAGLDLAGPANDASLTQFTSLAALLPLNGRARVDGPVAGNQRGATRVVRQYPGDAIEDGHEAVFQTAPPKRDIGCFLTSWLGGAPRIPAFDAAGCE